MATYYLIEQEEQGNVLRTSGPMSMVLRMMLKAEEVEPDSHLFIVNHRVFSRLNAQGNIADFKTYGAIH